MRAYAFLATLMWMWKKIHFVDPTRAGRRNEFRAKSFCTQDVVSFLRSANCKITIFLLRKLWYSFYTMHLTDSSLSVTKIIRVSTLLSWGIVFWNISQLVQQHHILVSKMRLRCNSWSRNWKNNMRSMVKTNGGYLCGALLALIVSSRESHAFYFPGENPQSFSPSDA